MHPGQATAGVQIGSTDHQAKIDEMIGDVLRHLDRGMNLKDRRRTIEELVTRSRELRCYLSEHARHAATTERRSRLLGNALLGRRLAWQHLASLIPGRRRWPGAAPAAVRSWLEGGGLIPLPDRARSC